MWFFGFKGFSLCFVVRVCVVLLMNVGVFYICNKHVGSFLPCCLMNKCKMNFKRKNLLVILSAIIRLIL